MRVKGIHPLCWPSLIWVGSFSHRNKAPLVRLVLAIWSLAVIICSVLFQQFQMKRDLANCQGFHKNHNNYLNCSVTAAKCSYIIIGSEALMAVGWPILKNGSNQIPVEQSCIIYCVCGAGYSEIYKAVSGMKYKGTFFALFSTVSTKTAKHTKGPL